MAIVVEDGTGKADANSYVSVVDAVAYAAARGVTVDPAGAEPFLILATDYLETLACKYPGEPTSDIQGLQWPRTGVVVKGQPVPDDEIPRALRNAQMQLVIEQANGFDLMPSSTGQFIKREKVDVLETEYATPTELGDSAVAQPSFPRVNALLASLLCCDECDEGGFRLRLRRI